MDFLFVALFVAFGAGDVDAARSDDRAAIDVDNVAHIRVPTDRKSTPSVVIGGVALTPQSTTAVPVGAGVQRLEVTLGQAKHQVFVRLAAKDYVFRANPCSLFEMFEAENRGGDRSLVLRASDDDVVYRVGGGEARTVKAGEAVSAELAASAMCMGAPVEVSARTRGKTERLTFFVFPDQAAVVSSAAGVVAVDIENPERSLLTPAVADACTAKTRVAVVTNVDDAAAGARWTATLRQAGCIVTGPGLARQQRAKTVVFARDVGADSARGIAAAAGASVEALTWASDADVVVALGAGR